MNSDVAAAEATIMAEYDRLCGALGIGKVALDVYLANDAADPVGGRSAAGVDLRHTDPCYSGHRRVLVIPLLLGDLEHVKTLQFPPIAWDKMSAEWPPWRIELWHEVIHQYSDLVLGMWDSKEPGRRREDRSLSTTGHGAGWKAAIDEVASKLGVRAEALDSLLDR